MFYIEKYRRPRIKDLALMHVGPTFIVFAAFLGLTLWSWVGTKHNIENERAQILTRNMEQTKATIQSRLATYEDILRAGSGLFGASDYVTREEWKEFVDVFDLNNRYPGAGSIGYAAVMSPSNMDKQIRKIQNGQQANYHIFPEGKRDIYVPIVYIEPVTDNSSKVIGYDMYSDLMRREPLEIAQDTGKAAITQPLQLIRETADTNQPGFLIYMPVYSQGPAPTTVEERRTRITGYVYMPFRAYDLFSKTVSDTNPNFGFQILYGSGDTTTPLYDSTSYQALQQGSAKQTVSQTFSVNNQQWTIAGIIGPNALTERETSRPESVLWGGTIFSVFVAGFIYLLLLNRTRLLADREAGEIQSAKDELLALASHQLRTPATGVKQYIGMLREGYAGPLNSEQQTYIEKAYASNERQLGTINEMLVVARADAGHLEITKANFDLNDLVSDVIQEQLGAIEERKQTIQSYMPKNHIHIHADQQYIRMAAENILSNATKYTPNGGTITVTLLQKKNRIHVAIRDTGVGVSKGDQPLLFQKFSRIPNELTSKVGGSGIGLYLAQKIIQDHDGEITFVSTPGEGSVCTIILPIRKPEKKK